MVKYSQIRYCELANQEPSTEHRMRVNTVLVEVRSFTVLRMM